MLTIHLKMNMTVFMVKYFISDISLNSDDLLEADIDSEDYYREERVIKKIKLPTKEKKVVVKKKPAQKKDSPKANGVSNGASNKASNGVSNGVEKP